MVGTGNQSGEISLYQVEGRQKVADVKLETNGPLIMSSQFHPDGTKLACSTIDGKVHVFDLG